MDEIILHHYDTSPFSEKVRLMFGLKGLAWRSVIQPSIMPKPDLVPLTGGYRRAPVMQIGADIFCDTQIILRELERRFPSPSLFPYGRGLPYALAFWSDRLFFMPSVGVVFAEVGHMVPEPFKQDRAKMSGGTFSTDALKAAAPFARDQWRAHAAFIEEHLTSGHPYLQGADPTANDVHVYMNFWWIEQAIPHVADTLLKEFRLVRAWIERVAAIGHGKPTVMDSEEALAIAKASVPEAKEAGDEFDPRGLKPGDRVTVAADAYGRDAVAGAIVFSNAHEIAIRRSDDQAGEVVVHFPRAGFTVVPAGH